MASQRPSRSTLDVLAYFLTSPTDAVYGLEIIKATGYRAGTVYPILERFENCGWLEAEWEDVVPKVVGRPRRRNYRLTSEGVRCALLELEQCSRWLGAALEALERTDPAVRAAALSYEEARWAALWRASMADEIEAARAAARASIQTDV